MTDGSPGGTRPYDSITSWSRPEPIVRRADPSEPRAEIADPAWMLARQWQFGELALEDAGSPVEADLAVKHDHLSRVRLGDADPFDYNIDDGPLEAIVEREDVTEGERPDARLAAESGLQFLSLLEVEGFTGDSGPYRPSDFPDRVQLGTPEDAVGATNDRIGAVLAGRALDGYAVFTRLRTAIESGWTTSTDLPLPEGTTANGAYRAAAEAFYEWYQKLYSEPTTESGSAWDSERLEYQFEVATGGGDEETVFEAAEYPGGRLDWYAFSESTGSLGASEREPSSQAVTRLPTAVSVPGMPVARFWEFEDAAVNLGTLTAGPESLHRLLLFGFATLYGNDWFTMAIEVPVGSLTHVTDFTVTDAFGVQTEIEAISDSPGRDWNMFKTMNSSATNNSGLFLPPVVGDVLESDPVERVVFTRDEMANIVFAVEEIIEGPGGTPLRPRELHPISATEEPNQNETSGVDGGDITLPAYRLLTELPAHWFPFVPHLEERSYKLKRAALLDASTLETGEVHEPRGDILQTVDTLFEEEVTRASTEVTRSYQLTRWAGGSAHLWSGRRAGVGRGESRSGLLFDYLEGVGSNE